AAAGQLVAVTAEYGQVAAALRAEVAAGHEATARLAAERDQTLAALRTDLEGVRVRLEEGHREREVAVAEAEARARAGQERAVGLAAEVEGLRGDLARRTGEVEVERAGREAAEEAAQIRAAEAEDLRTRLGGAEAAIATLQTHLDQARAINHRLAADADQRA